MKKLVISAFEPFGKDTINASSIVLELLPDEISNIKIYKIVLPVLYGKAFEILMDFTAKVKPDYILCMGQAGGRKKISFERVAVNINSSDAPDNDGTILHDHIIIENKATAYMTNMPVMDMMNNCNREIAGTSYSAGTFVCNDIFYRCLHNFDGDNSVKVGFLHLPYTEHFGKMPFKDSKEQVDAIVKMIGELGD